MGISTYENCEETSLQYDQACLEVIASEFVTFWSNFEQCEGCRLLETAYVARSRALVVGTTSALRYALKNGTQQICNGTYQFGEFGRYELNLTSGTTGNCPPRVVVEPHFASLPLLIAGAVLISMAALWYIVKGVGKRLAAGRHVDSFFKREEDKELGVETTAPSAKVDGRYSARARVRSLDVFRGMCVALMVFVNAGGGGYTMFKHSVWDGLTVADVVFPWFAFAMGQALVLSLRARLKTGLPRTTALYQVFRRALLMTLIDIVLSSENVSWSEVRLPGVLQRLAFMYLLVGAVECVFHVTSANITPGKSLFLDLSAGWKQWLFTLTLVTIQVCVSMLVAAPGCPRGYSGPGGLHLSEHGDNSLQDCTGGIASYIDRKLFGSSHLMMTNYASVYKTYVRHDPYGLLGSLSGVLVVQAGAHASRVMLSYNRARSRILRWVVWSALMGVPGAALGGFGRGGVIPINTKLWSLSFCLVNSASAMLITAILYYIVDVKNKWRGGPFYYAGHNALFLYVGSRVLKKHFPLYYKIHAPTHAQLLAAHTATMLIWLAVGMALYKRRVFISL
ncbi:heparan-alpha-glucosaminide N-acetyltransferase [Phthorimaea operculella]|nr:heparan-alpha-glucosaminide N-acetyltransferase [Phthorimaea operculella]